MKKLTKLLSLVLILALCLSLGMTANADLAEFEYKITLTDGNGAEVYNPRDLKAGDTLHVEIELTRTDTSAVSYDCYGLEFRIRSRGLEYNGDGASFRSGTPVTKQVFSSGDSVGFAYYDMQQVGERIANPVLAGRWSYTVTDPYAVNLTVPVAVMYIVHDSEAYEPVGNARLFLDPAGGEILGEDVSGEYRTDDVVILPGAEYADHDFLGWSDGAELFPAGSEYKVTGFVTLTAQYEGRKLTRQVLFDPKGGEFPEGDPSSMYADGDVVTIPMAEREGYDFDGWLLGDRIYAPGEEYTVDNSVVFAAQWTKIRTVTFDLDGGVIVGGDPETEYREGDVIVLPEAEKDGYEFKGWTDGENTYKAGDKYTVEGDKTLTAVWETLPTPTPEPTPEPSAEPSIPPVVPAPGPGGGISPGLLAVLIAAAVVVLGGLGWWLIVLGKRRYVLYSLKNGDVALSYKDREHEAQVEVFLKDGDREILLNRSGKVPVKHRLRFIKSTGEIPIAEVKTGKYNGRLVVKDGLFTRELKRKIKVLDREIRERENK